MSIIVIRYHELRASHNCYVITYLFNLFILWYYFVCGKYVQFPGPDEVASGERRQSSGRGGRGGHRGGPARPRPEHANSAPRRRRTRYIFLYGVHFWLFTTTLALLLKVLLKVFFIIR